MKCHARLPLIALLVTAAGLAGCASRPAQENYQGVSDATISNNVKTALVQDPVTRASNISVNTIDGTVELSGFVNTADQRHEAIRVARNVDGVQTVKDELRVNDQGDVGAADTDNAITRRVERALASDSQVSDANINVATSDGVVQLAGFVNSDQQRDTAGSLASSVQGVRKVDNDLRINPGD